MNKTTFIIALILLMATSPHTYAQSVTGDKQQYAFLGDFTLENGSQILDCKIGYRVFGKLNALRNNAVIYPTGAGGTTAGIQMFGVGKDVDTTKFYLILIDALGNGVSSSPSNSTKQPKSRFPQFSIVDMVNSEYKMLTEQLNIHHLAAIVGGSMGGLQALQWAVSYPDFMDKVVAIEASPKFSANELMWTKTYLDAIKNDSAWHGGEYTKNPVLPAASHILQLVLTSPANLNHTVPVDSFTTWLASADQFPVDWDDDFWQTTACTMHDITAKAGGTMESAAKKIKAKLLFITNKQDHMVSSDAIIKFAGITKAKLIIMDNELGHLVFFEKIPLEATRKFLSE